MKSYLEVTNIQINVKLAKKIGSLISHNMYFM